MKTPIRRIGAPVLLAVVALAALGWWWQSGEPERQRNAENLRMRDALRRSAEGAQRAWVEGTPAAVREAQREAAMKDFRATEDETRGRHALAELQRRAASAASAASAPTAPGPPTRR